MVYVIALAGWGLRGVLASRIGRLIAGMLVATAPDRRSWLGQVDDG